MIHNNLMTTETTFLSAVPFPLLAPSTQLLPEGDPPELVEPQEENSPHPTMQQRMFQSLIESLVDVGQLPSRPANIRQRFAQEYQLNHVFGDYYHSSPSPHKALKLAAIYCTLKDLDLPNIRLSRQTAAWVWGYLPVQDKIHIDFERARRAATYRMHQHGIVPHQLNEFLSGETIHFFGIDVTTPLRTVLDILQFENASVAEQVVHHFLADPDQEMSFDTLIEIVSRRKYLQNKSHCLDVLDCIK